MSSCLIYFVIVFLVLMFICLNPRYDSYYLVVKTCTSLGFLLIAAVGAIIYHRLPLFMHLLPAYCCCFTGDILLGINHYKKSKKMFLSGLISFLFGHIFFIYGLSQHVPLIMFDFIMPIMSLVVTYFLLKIKGMQVGSLKPAIYVYSFFVTILFSKGLNVYLQDPSVYFFMFMTGAFFFMFSDSVILFLYFYEKKHKFVKVLNLSTYYFAMFLLAYSIIYF